jgi:PilZ domain
MAGTMRHERRAWKRVLALTMEGMERARLRPGRTAHIVDLSSGGALIETDWRLLPGVRVEMQVGDPVPLFRVAGRILRCQVALLDRERIRYRGALMFEKQLPFGEPTTRSHVG